MGGGYNVMALHHNLPFSMALSISSEEAVQRKYEAREGGGADCLPLPGLLD